MVENALIFTIHSIRSALDLRSAPPTKKFDPGVEARAIGNR
jgi:hypothetical protein